MKVKIKQKRMKKIKKEKKPTLMLVKRISTNDVELAVS